MADAGEINGVVDLRRFSTETVEAKAEEIAESPYEDFTPILDRVQIKALNEVEYDNDGIQVPPKYRQHSNKGIVVKVGQWVILSGLQIPMSQVLKPGDRVLFGEYNCEKFVESREEYELVRIQDIRGVERLKETQ